MQLRLLLLAALAMAALDRAPPPATVRLVVRVRAGARIDLGSATWGPAAARLVRRAAEQIELELDRAELEAFEVRAAGACAARVPPSKTPRAGAAVVQLEPLMVPSASGDLAQLGYGTEFRVRLEPSCNEARDGTVTWRQVEGSSLAYTVGDSGWSFGGRTQTFADAHGDPPPWGIVPVSPRTRGSAVFEAKWTGAAAEHRLEVRLAAAARSSGLPSAALGQRLLLSGDGWSVLSHPAGATGRVTAAGPISAIELDVPGSWRLADRTGRELALTAGAHASTPLDCGRAECHPREVEAAASTPMTRAFANLVERADIPDPGCAVACHTAGEPGLRDGGFVHLLGAFAWPRHIPPGPGTWRSMPRALRRVAGVGCTACHGPASIPAPSARWAILRSDVCATCHDSPPRYAHVEGWRRSSMSRADRDEDARTKRACRGCHTTAGFLDRLGARADAVRPDPDLEMGIGCAACHAPHGAHTGGALLRAVPVPDGLPEAAASVCAPCHAPTGASRVEATAATLVYGSASGKHGPHAAVPGGCVGCHGRARAGHAGARGAAHDFEASDAECSGCHPEGDAMPSARRESDALRERAKRLARSLGVVPGGRPPHARELRPPDEPERARAWRGVLTVLEDPAAGAHNAPLARELLDEADCLLARAR